MRGYYTFTSEGKEVTLRFNTWAGHRFCKLKGISFEDYLNFLQNSMNVENFALLLLCAHESFCLSAKEPFEAKEYDSFCWIDSLGGLGSDGMAGMIQAIKEGNEPQGEPDKEKKQESR